MKFKNKHIARISLSLCGLLSFGVCDAAESETAPYDGSWKSLQAMPVPAWFDDGKIGLFIHWGLTVRSATGVRLQGHYFPVHHAYYMQEQAKACAALVELLIVKNTVDFLVGELNREKAL